MEEVTISERGATSPLVPVMVNAAEWNTASGKGRQNSVLERANYDTDYLRLYSYRAQLL